MVPRGGGVGWSRRRGYNPLETASFMGWNDPWTPPWGDPWYKAQNENIQFFEPDYPRGNRLWMENERKRRYYSETLSRPYKYRTGYGYGRKKEYKGGYFVKSMPYRRSRRSYGRKRRYGRGYRVKRTSYRAKRAYRQKVVVLSRKKLAGEFDLNQLNISVLIAENTIRGGATAAAQCWNSIPQGVLASEHLGIRANRTGLWCTFEFFRDATQVATSDNWDVRVIFASQKAESAVPTTGAASGTAPAWPDYFGCFTREWKRSYRLLKDTKVHFGAGGLDITAVNKRKMVTFKFKTTGHMGWEGTSADMNVGRIYMYVIAPQSTPATVTDLHYVLKHYCNWFVDQLA